MLLLSSNLETLLFLLFIFIEWLLSVPQQAGGFIKKTTLEFQILPRADRKDLLLAH